MQSFLSENAVVESKQISKSLFLKRVIEMIYAFKSKLKMYITEDSPLTPSIEGPLNTKLFMFNLIPN